MKKSALGFPAFLSILLTGSIFMSSCNEDEPAPQPNIVAVAASNSNFSTLVSAVDRAGLVPTLSGTGPFTVFAPTNDAFGRFLADNSLSADQLLSSEQLGTVLTYHVLGSEVRASAVAAGKVNTAANLPFYVSVDPSGGIWINGSSKVIQTDINASNGVIHVLDYVITPPSQPISQIAVAASTSSSAPQFTQLVAALARANLVDALSGGISDDLTVFAPTDEAFQNLYATLGVTSVDQIPLETLTNVLLYHVVPARAFSQDLRQGASLPTLLSGKNLSVDLANLKINDASLIASSLNIHAVNGVIHVIDKVMLPE